MTSRNLTNTTRNKNYFEKTQTCKIKEPTNRPRHQLVILQIAKNKKNPNK